jgi:hypothetical protein
MICLDDGVSGMGDRVLHSRGQLEKGQEMGVTAD